ncbi:MAG TPA: hypothetical protein DD730_11455 [Desulfosporosinus sp.]|nr:hypothetical protein [Desulfosporosinus sp.]
MKIRSRRIITALGVTVLLIGCNVSWQLYKVQKISNPYAVDAQKLSQGSVNRPRSASSQTQGPDRISSAVSPNQTPPSAGSTSSKNYKQSMFKTYQQTLHTMENIKTNTLALQSRKMTLSSYKASILESQTSFSSAEAYVRANPPTDARLNTSYKELLEGISLAKQAMAVVLSGISSFSVSKLYSAREMGITAQQQVVNGYSHL